MKVTSTTPLNALLFSALVCASALPSEARLRKPVVSLPDLKVLSISQSPSSPLAGQTVTFSAVVQNVGIASTPVGATIGLSFLVNNVATTWGANSSITLAPGASMTITARGRADGSAGATWIATAGAHTIQAFVDDVNRIAESDELNNKFSQSLTVASAQLAPSPAGTPVATPTPSPISTTGSDVTINQVINDMSMGSEALPIDPRFNWMYKPVITQHSPAGSSIASWWTGERPSWCYGLLSWYTLFEAQGNTAINTRVEVKNLRVYILSQSTRQWSRWDLAVAPNTGLWVYPFNSAGSPERKVEADGGVSFRPVYPNFMHGYGTSNYPARGLPNPADVRAIYTAIDLRLVVADAAKPDDRANAKYVVDSGADYYPDATYKMWSAGYAPGVGNGRYILATPNWRSATLIVPNKDLGATVEELRLNPPPLK